MRVRRLALVVALLAGLAAPANADAATFFLFDRASAAPNDSVTVRGVGVPSTPVRLYLLRRDVAHDAHSRFDRRLSFVGSIVGDRAWRGATTLSVPPLDAGAYTLAYWCRACGQYSRGRTFVVQEPEEFAARYRARAVLRIEAPAGCPVTLPNGSRPPGQPRTVAWYGNGLLWAGISRDGTYAVPPDRVGADGSIGNKLLWATRPASSKPAVSGERLDAPAPPLRVLGVNRGSFAGAERPSYMSAVTFPTAGCWRVRARVGDVSLTYVVSVIVR
jgi:hypothetical protein